MEGWAQGSQRQATARLTSHSVLSASAPQMRAPSHPAGRLPSVRCSKARAARSSAGSEPESVGAAAAAAGGSVAAPASGPGTGVRLAHRALGREQGAAGRERRGVSWVPVLIAAAEGGAGGSIPPENVCHIHKPAVRSRARGTRGAQYVDACQDLCARGEDVGAGWRGGRAHRWVQAACMQHQAHLQRRCDRVGGAELDDGRWRSAGQEV